jgi:predicted TIM-barrel fold metal-dependent hydrolase
MTTALAAHILSTSLCDTHEHLRTEQTYTETGPDILQSLFENYVSADLVVAGAPQPAVQSLLDAANPDVRERFAAVRPAWERVRHTGYGEAVRIIAREIYEIDELTPDAIEAAQPRHAALRKPGERLRILREVANLDHVQIDHFQRSCPPDLSGPDFFFYDISWAAFSRGQPDLGPLAEETGVEVRDLASLRQAMETVFRQNSPTAIAVKSQHAYNRTLRWQPRSDREAAKALAAYQLNPEEVSEEDRLCLGDWCWARGVELAIEHDLPFKIHTGYYAGHSRMPVDYIRGGNLCPLLAHYLDARFVLMHIAYPYNDELVALAKHYPNVYVDLCWAWSIDPYSAGDFVRRCIHAVPSNKLFIYGGDTGWPTASYAYTQQARRWLARALQGEVDDGLLTEAEAMGLATRWMRTNQYECFHVARKQEALRSAANAMKVL